MFGVPAFDESGGMTRVSRDARNALVRENLAIVGYLVNDVARKAPHVSRDELASAGALGLVLAAERFDPSQGVPFGAYARRRILGAIADEMRSADWVSRGTRQRIRESLHVQESLSRALGRMPTVKEVAVALGVDVQTVTDALADAAHTVQTLDETVADQVAAELASPEDRVLADERTRYLRAAVSSLPERARYIVEQIYFHDRSVGELAEELGITHSAVSQQRSLAMRMMRDGLETHYAESASDTTSGASDTKLASARRAEYLARLAENSSARLATRLPEHAVIKAAS